MFASQIDLGRVYNVVEIQIRDRTECCPHRYSIVEVLNICYLALNTFNINIQYQIGITDEKHWNKQVRVGPARVTSAQQYSPIPLNSPCGNPQSNGAQVNGIYVYACTQPLGGRFVSVQKLDTSQGGTDRSFGVNEIEIFHDGKCGMKSFSDRQLG